MARFTAIDLSTLAAPDVIDTLDFEAILAALKADFAARVPDYDMSMIESDLAVKNPGGRSVQGTQPARLLQRQDPGDPAGIGEGQ